MQHICVLPVWSIMHQTFIKLLFSALAHCLCHRRDSGNKLVLSHRQNCRTVCLTCCRKWKIHCEKCRVQKKNGLAVRTSEWHQIADYSCFCQSFACYQVICIKLFRNGHSVSHFHSTQSETSFPSLRKS